MHQHKCHLDCEIKILVKASCGFWSNLSGPFITHIEGGMKRSGGGGVSPVVEVTANTSLSALHPQYGIRSQLSQHTHTCSYAHTCHACIVWRGMTSPHTHTNTPKQLQRGESPGPAGTDGVSWDLTACPAAPKSHTHTNTQVEGTQQSELCIPR